MLKGLKLRLLLPILIGVGVMFSLPKTCAGTGGGSLAPAGRKSTASVGATVFCTVTFDNTGGDYVYEYSIRAHSQNADAVDMFGLREVGQHYGVEMPPGWWVIEAFEDAPRSLVWVAVGYGGQLESDLGFLRDPPPNAVLPGELVTGFRLRSAQSSTYTGFVAHPFTSNVYESDADVPMGPFTPTPSIWSGGNFGSVEVPRPVIPTLDRDTMRTSGGVLGRPNPNPTRDVVQMSINVGQRGYAKIEIVDAAGRRVATPLRRWVEPGRTTASWGGVDDDGRRVPGGIYFVRMTLNGVDMGQHRIVIVR